MFIICDQEIDTTEKCQCASGQEEVVRSITILHCGCEELAKDGCKVNHQVSQQGDQLQVCRYIDSVVAAFEYDHAAKVQYDGSEHQESCDVGEVAGEEDTFKPAAVHVCVCACVCAQDNG